MEVDNLHGVRTVCNSIATPSRTPEPQSTGLKIDRSLVRALSGDPGHLADRQTNPAAQARAVVRSVAEIGRTLDLTVVADGIEAEQQRRQLWELGCSAGQGTMFGPPVSAVGLPAALTRGFDNRPGTLGPPCTLTPTSYAYLRHTPVPAPPEGNAPLASAM